MFDNRGEIIEGDIQVNTGQTNTYRSYQAKTWPNGEVPYVIHSASVEENAKNAMHLIKTRTSGCIEFVRRDIRMRNYINITSSNSGCSSSVAPQGGGQLVIIGPGCNTVGIIIHELMHALGFWHEHSRVDRDAYVQVYLENVIEGTKSNFNKRQFPASLLDIPYDYYSILHYKYNEFAKVKTMTTIAPRNTTIHKEALGQRERLSFYDVKKIKKLYRCVDYDKNPDACTPPDYEDVTAILPDFVLEVGVVLKFSCPNALSLIGPLNSTCQQTLTWSGAVPFCAENKSGPLTYCDMGDCLSAWSFKNYSQPPWKRRQHVSDHTYGSNSGSFLSVENMQGNYSQATTPWMKLKSNNDVSIMFYYRMSENSILSIGMMDENREWRRICSESGPKNDKWYLKICHVTRVSGTRALIAFKAFGSIPTSSIWIDDFVFGPKAEIEKYKRHIESAVSQGKPPEYDELELLYGVV